MSVKSLFSSRYPNGVLIQADHSQLEVRVLAYLSQDETLINEMTNGVDIHTSNCQAWKRRQDISPEERTSAKAMTFQLTYGSGPGNMSITLKIDFDEAKAFINSFYQKYSSVKEWHDTIIEQVKQNNTNNQSWLQGLSGRRWSFTAGPAPQYLQNKGIMFSFKPQDIKNYPVQGTAADILIIQRGVLFRKAMEHRDKFLIVNTVHDSIMLDCKEEYVTMATDLLKEVMEDSSEINKVFDKEFNVPLIADVSSGKSWAEVK